MLAGLYTVIVNWNLKADTLECLESLVAAGSPPEQIILVDNGSTDGSLETFQQRFGSRLRVIANSTNLGYAPATNQGIHRALEAGAQWILLLNNDTVVAPDFFTQAEIAITGCGEYAILAPIIFYYAEPKKVWYLGDRLIPGTLITLNPYRGKEYNQAFPEPVPVDFASGCAMFVRGDVFMTVGVFDPALEMYGEEVDWIWRARLRGYRVAAIPGVRMWHKVSLSAQRNAPRTRYLRIRNQARFYRRYAGGLQRPAMLLFTLLRAGAILAQDLLHRRFDLVLPLIQGLQEGWWGAK